MKCYTGGTLARFPSGQRGWTQDPLRKASQVRILPSPPLIINNFCPQLDLEPE